MTDDPRPWCIAPSAALYFDPEGFVLPCCFGLVPYGRIGPGPDGSLHAIWDGAVRRSIQAAVLEGDLTMGCRTCAVEAAAKGRSSSGAVWFDRWSGEQRDGPLELDLALSNRCNLQCTMCNGTLSSTIRARREHLEPLPKVYDDRFFDELADFLPGVRKVAFKGGEPFLASESRRVMDLLIAQGSTAEVRVTTNGTVWSDEVAHYLRALRMSPLVSIDAMDPDVLERVRIGVNPSILWRNIDRIQAEAAATGHRMTFSYCLMPQTWQELAPLLVEAEARDAFVAVACVSQPSSSSLLGLGPGALAEILSGMHAQAAGLGSLRPENRAAWEGAIAWVEHCRRSPARPAGEAGVELVARVPVESVPPPAPSPLEVPEPANDELARWSGASTIAIQAQDGRISSVTGADWSEGLERSLVGSDLDQLPDLLGAATRRELVLRLDGSDRASLVEAPSGAIVARAAYAADEHRVHLVLALGPSARRAIRELGPPR